MQVAGRALNVITLILCAAATWFVARAVQQACPRTKRNTLPAVLVELAAERQLFAVESKRSKAMHKVWSLPAGGNVRALQGLVRPEQAATAPESHSAELSSRVIAKRLAVLPDRECFSGLAAKSRELSCLSGLLKRGGSSPGAPAGTAVACQSRLLRLRSQRRARGTIRRHGLTAPAVVARRLPTWPAMPISRRTSWSWRRPSRRTRSYFEHTVLFRCTVGA